MTCFDGDGTVESFEYWPELAVIGKSVRESPPPRAVSDYWPSECCTCSPFASRGLHLNWLKQLCDRCFNVPVTNGCVCL